MIKVLENKQSWKLYFLLITLFAAAITSVHFFIFKKTSPYVVLEELYYIPIFLGAFKFGLKGAVPAYIIVSIFYIPLFFGGWSPTFLALVDRFFHLALTGLFAFFTGFLVDREMEKSRKAERERFLAETGEVVTSIVHDLKNPAITILNFSRRVKEGKGDIQKSAQAIIDAAMIIERLVCDVLDFSRPAHFNLEKVDIRNAVRRASETCMAKSDRKGVPISIEMPGQEATVPADAFHLQRALVNLIDNAIEASQAGRDVLVKVSQENDSVLIIIKDYGEGIDKETLENIFVPFYTRKKGGTGLGLPIAKKIIEGHNGKISVKSRLGAGTEVIVDLPA